MILTRSGKLSFNCNVTLHSHDRLRECKTIIGRTKTFRSDICHQKNMFLHNILLTHSSIIIIIIWSSRISPDVRTLMQVSIIMHLYIQLSVSIHASVSQCIQQSTRPCVRPLFCSQYLSIHLSITPAIIFFVFSPIHLYKYHSDETSNHPSSNSEILDFTLVDSGYNGS